MVDTHTYGTGGMIVTLPSEWKDVNAYVPLMPAILIRTYGEEASILLTAEGRTLA